MTVEPGFDPADIDRERFPNFLIVGANKGGTTSLYHYLRQHPEIGMASTKEPRFFSSLGQNAAAVAGAGWRDSDPQARERVQRAIAVAPPPVTTLREYHGLFDHCAGLPARGEASTNYLSAAPRVIPLIHSMAPKMKIVASLRNPVDRAYSYYLMRRSQGVETRSFAEVMEARPESRMDPCAKLGLYADPVARYQRAFGRERCLFLPYDLLHASPLEFLRAVFRFLDLDTDFKPDVGQRHNRAEDWVKGDRGRAATRLSDTEFARYAPLFAADLRALDPLVEFDPLVWLERASAAQSWRPRQA